MTSRAIAAHTVLFIGDSITDAGRRDNPDQLGQGYVRLIAERVAVLHGTCGITVVNRGVAGDRVRDLRARWDVDCIEVDPDVVSVFVGVNDTWRGFDSDDPTSPSEFERDYREILRRLPEGSSSVVIEPFVLPVQPDQGAWLPDLAGKSAVARRMAEEFGATLIPAGRHLRDAFEDLRSAAADGVHPTPGGHQVIADAWLTAVPCPECATPLGRRSSGTQ